MISLCRSILIYHAKRRRFARTGQGHAVHACDQHSDDRDPPLLVLFPSDSLVQLKLRYRRPYSRQLPADLFAILLPLYHSFVLPRFPRLILCGYPQCKERKDFSTAHRRSSFDRILPVSSSRLTARPLVCIDRQIPSLYDLCRMRVPVSAHRRHMAGTPMVRYADGGPIQRGKRKFPAGNPSPEQRLLH